MGGLSGHLAVRRSCRLQVYVCHHARGREYFDRSKDQHSAALLIQFPDIEKLIRLEALGTLGTMGWHEWLVLEPAASRVTVRRSNQLNCHPKIEFKV